MVKIRLRRKGRIHNPVYDIVAMDARSRRDGAYLERLGYYDPNTSPSTISIDPKSALYWLGVGAQPTEIVRQLLSYEGILLRKAMAHKGKSETEIEDMVKKHKEVATARHGRLKAARKKRDADRAKAAAKAAEAPAVEAAPVAAAEEAPAETAE